MGNLQRYKLRWTALGVLALSVVLVAIGAASSPNSLKEFIAVINGGQEVPPVNSPFQGVAHMTFDPSTKMLSFSISFDGLTSPEVAAHFHAPARPGIAAGVLFPLPAGNPKIGTVGPLTNQEIGWLQQGRFYINIHSANFPPGEIRGQVLRIR